MQNMTISTKNQPLSPERSETATPRSERGGISYETLSAEELESTKGRSLCASSQSPAPTPTRGEEYLSKLRNLTLLLHEGYISRTEFQVRKEQLEDDGGRFGASSAVAEEEGADFNQQTSSDSVPRPPPDFSSITEQQAIKHTFCLTTRQWESQPIRIKLDPLPFAKGGLRIVYHMQDLSAEEETRQGSQSFGSLSYVAKISMDPYEDPDTYFRDVEMQAHCAHYAALYNSYSPPLRVEFVKAWVLQLVDQGNKLCGVERFISGEYRKHNNNNGYVSQLRRNTPQAFSHFTYEASGHTLLVVDIQGCGDCYTDPQIHTSTGKQFGKGNLGNRGIDKFLASHRCNAICRYLKLPLINPQDNPRHGTIPSQLLMPYPRVETVKADLTHYYDNSQAFRSHVMRSRRASSRSNHFRWEGPARFLSLFTASSTPKKSEGEESSGQKRRTFPTFWRSFMCGAAD